MGGGRGTMRAGPARRDPEFRGIDTDALGHLIKQVKDATTAIKGWLNAHPLPPDVPRTGVRMATEVDLWASSQLGMLIRRRNYALTHPDRVHEMPKPGSPALGSGAGPGGDKGGDKSGGTARDARTGSGRGTGTGTGTGKGGAGRSGGGVIRVVPVRGGRPQRRTTPSGAGPHLGNFPTQQAAAKAAAADVLAVRRAAAGHAAPPAEVWRHLGANADDPDYTAAFYARLGPAGTAALIAAAHDDRARLGVISESLGTGSHHAPIDEKWLRALVADAGPAHRADVVRVLRDADLSDKAAAALGRLGDLDAPRSSHQPIDHGPADHGPVHHEPADHGPVHHEPAGSAPGQASGCPPGAR